MTLPENLLPAEYMLATLRVIDSVLRTQIIPDLPPQSLLAAQLTALRGLTADAASGNVTANYVRLMLETGGYRVPLGYPLTGRDLAVMQAAVACEHCDHWPCTCVTVDGVPVDVMGLPSVPLERLRAQLALRADALSDALEALDRELESGMRGSDSPADLAQEREFNQVCSDLRKVTAELKRRQGKE